jgi:uncharacterized repeat protein (TIGR01451 family)
MEVSVMPHSLQRQWVVAMALGILLAPAIAPATAGAAGEVSVVLTAQRVTLVDGRETKSPADEARPGDVIEYRAEYVNGGDAPVQKLAATLPVPSGMEYLPRSAWPQVLFASLDGRTFEPVPLKRRVRLEDGREVMREVPPAEYRYLRWSLGTLDVRQKRAVTARVQVSPLQIAAR